MKHCTRTAVITVASATAPVLAIEVQVPSAEYPTLSVALLLAQTDDIDTITLLDTASGDAADFIGSFDLNPANRQITIQGEAGADVIVDAFGTGSVFRVSDPDLDGLVIRNLTIRGGQAANGGGLDFNAAITVTVEDCLFIKNGNDTPSGIGSTSRGGAISCGWPASGSAVTGGTLNLLRCGFVGNSSSAIGGAIYINDYRTNITDCTFEDNACPRVPDTDPVPSVGEGGAIFMNNDLLAINGTVFRNNFAADDGGAIVISGGNGAGEIDRASFFDNAAGRVDSPQGRGGAIRVNSGGLLDMTNSVLVRNFSAFFGPAIYIQDNVDLAHCTVVDNTSATAGASSAFNLAPGGSLEATNCIIRGATSVFTGTNAQSVFLSYTNYTGSPGIPGAPSVNGTIDADPMFVDPTNDDYRLMNGSPCIDSGDSITGTGSIVQLDIATDFGGNVRGIGDPDTPNTGVSAWDLCVDMGAFEFQPFIVGNNPCPGDTTTTGATLMGQEGFGEPDGTVDLDDLGYFLGVWLAGCPL
ncbi:MAG: hypothetical protein AAGB51_14940 [Planctomycetota bacterium]